MTKESTSLAVQETAPFVKASSSLANFLGVESGMMLTTIKAQCFKSTTPDKVSDEQLAAFVSVANTLKLNPLLGGMLYCYPTKSGGIEPMIGPDGIFTLLSNNPDIVKQADGGPAWYTEQGKEGNEDICTAYINHATKGLLKKKIYLSEWVVSSNPNWQSRRRHMAEVRALKQCARQVVHGVPLDEDERALAEMVNVTNTVTETPPERPDPSTVKRGPGRPPKGAAAAAQAQEPAKPAEAPAIDIAATPAAEVPREAEKPADPVAVTALQKGEKRTATVQIVHAQYEDFAGSDGAIITVSGQYVGKLYDLSGGMKHTSGPMAKPVWAVGKTVTVDILGRNSKALGVIAIVEKVTPVEEADLP